MVILASGWFGSEYYDVFSNGKNIDRFLTIATSFS